MRYQAGCNSSLLDIFLSNIPERISGIDNFYNTMSEHDGVMCTVLTKTPIKEAKSILLRDYKLARFDIIQPMIDNNENLQSLFSDQDPEDNPTDRRVHLHINGQNKGKTHRHED